MSFAVTEKVLVGTGTAEALSSTNLQVHRAWIQVKRTNSNAIQIAPGSFTTGKAYELVKPTADEQLPEFPLHESPSYQNGIDLKDWSIMGTAGEGVNIIYEIF